MNRLVLFTPIFLLSALNLFAQTNLVKDGDFSDSTLVSWTFNSNGAIADASYDKTMDGRLIINISKPGISENSPQLQQSGISLEAGEAYTLAFKITSTKTIGVRAIVASDNGILSDSVKGLIEVPGDAKLKAYSFDFYVEQISGLAKLNMNFGISRKDSVKILIDSVTLVKKTEPAIRVMSPLATDRWVAGTERQIIWRNSGSLEQVKIVFTNDNGTTWKTISAAANNAHSFWWKVPADFTGDSCRIIVSNISGTVADTSGNFKIISTGTIVAGELIKNGDFLDTTDWKFSLNGSAKAKGSIIDDQYEVDISTSGSESWMVKLEQPGLTLQSGKMYVFSFKASASHERTIYANVGGENGSPSYSIYGGDTIDIDLGTEKSTFTAQFVMSYPTSSNIRVEFNMGNDTGKVYIDDVSLLEMDAPKVLVSKPGIGSFLKPGELFTIQWGKVDVPVVTIQYSIDNAKTWLDVVTGINNLNAYEWKVPQVSSEKCFIRIKDTSSVNDSTSELGRSSVFQINKFGTVIKTGDLVTNGTFSSNLKGWTTSFNGGATGKGVVSTNGVFGLEINEPGSVLENIVLSQGNLMVLNGKEYVLKFKAFANGTRDMQIRIVAEDTVVLLDSVLTVPTVSQELIFKFTPANDYFAMLEFNIGGSRAGVFLDDIKFGTDLPILSVTNRIAPVQSDILRIVNIAGIFRFIVGENVQGKIGIFNLSGSLVRMLSVSGSVVWDGHDSNGKIVAKGTYIAAFRNSSIKQVQKLLVR